MAKPKKAWEEQRVLANYLYAEEDVDQKEIARRLGGVHQTSVSRWLKEGATRGLWEAKRLFYFDELNDEEKGFVKSYREQGGVRRSLHRWAAQHEQDAPEVSVE